MWKHLGPLAALVLLSVPAQALTIKGSPDNVATIEKATDLLSNCEMEAALGGGLKSISVVKHGALSTRDIGGHVYIIQADSFFRSGHVYIDVAYTKNPVVTLHEMYHWIWQDLVLHDYYHAWIQATNLDYIDQPYDAEVRNRYLKTPEEAWAELGAYRELGERYWDYSKYRVDQYPRANAMMAEILEKACGQSASQ